MSKLSKILHRYEFWIPVLLGLLFILVNLPGVSWGTPSLWHPDELIHRVIKALNGEWVFDETNFDYPSLPKYVMYGVGKVVYALGGSKQTFIISARLVSVILGGLTVGLVYRIVRLAGGNIPAGILAAFLLISNSQMAINARWAHNDLYLLFFITLSLYAVIHYSLSGQKRLWLYFSFYCAGLAASSKYNGGSILLTPLIIFLFLERKTWRQHIIRNLEILFISFILSIFGYVTGTPKALLWMAFYFKRLIPALQRHSVFGWEPGSLIGAWQQWVALPSFWGWLIFLWMLAALMYMLIRLVKSYFRARDLSGNETAWLAIVIALLVLDLPILFSYNIQLRFFLPQAPMLVVLAALFAQDLFEYARIKQKLGLVYLLTGVIVLVLAYSFLRVISVSLLMTNDARIAATDYLDLLPTDRSVEYTYYPPTFPKKHFSSITSYPLVVLKYPGQETPENRFYDLNVGEAGVEERQPDYLVFDSFTVDRFENEYLCSLHPADCSFFERLKAGETNYELIATFEYSLPAFLPDPKIAFVNPRIDIYQRVSSSE